MEDEEGGEGEREERRGTEREGREEMKEKEEEREMWRMGKIKFSPPPTHPHTHPLSTTRIPTYPTSISQMRYQVPTNPPPSRDSVSG